jgi:N-acetylmuramoyl-L-alanine amidase
MKIAIVIGHNAKSQGAVRVTDGVTEFAWNAHLAELIAAHAPDSTKVFQRTSEGGYSAEIDRVYAETDKWGANCVVELHFNASGSAGVSGCETLTSGTKSSVKLAVALQEQMVKALKNKDRGIKPVLRTDRGGRSLWQGKAPAALIEPYFGSSRDECINADLNKDALAEAVYRGCLASFGVAMTPPKPAMLTPVEAPASPRALIAERKLRDTADALRRLAASIDPR